jgi:hypothetical protein
VQKIIFLTFFISAWAQASETNSLKIFNRSNQQKPSAVLSWNLDQKKCWVEVDDSVKSKNMDFAECKKIDAFITTNKVELEDISSKGFSIEKRKKLQGEHVPLALIEFQKLKFAILKGARETCNLATNECRPTSALTSDKLGFMVLDLLNSQN